MLPSSAPGSPALRQGRNRFADDDRSMLGVTAFKRTTQNTFTRSLTIGRGRIKQRDATLERNFDELFRF